MSGTGGRRRVVRTIVISEWLAERVDEAVRKYGFSSRSELIRAALREYLDKLGRVEGGRG